MSNTTQICDNRHYIFFHVLILFVFWLLNKAYLWQITYTIFSASAYHYPSWGGSDTGCTGQTYYHSIHHVHISMRQVWRHVRYNQSPEGWSSPEEQHHAAAESFEVGHFVQRSPPLDVPEHRHTDDGVDKGDEKKQRPDVEEGGQGHDQCKQQLTDTFRSLEHENKAINVVST